MSFFEEASAFLKTKQPEIPTDEDILMLDTPAQVDAFTAFLRREYENATTTEIDRALRQGQESLEKPYNKKLFLKKIRVKLED